MQIPIKSIFSYCSLIGLCMILPINSYAKEKDQEPETLIGAPLIGSKYTELKQPLTSLNGTPEAPNFSKCMRLGILTMVPQFQCEYLASDGINYHIDRNGIIYKIKMIADTKGNFPKQLPFGIQKGDSAFKVEARLRKIGLNYKHDNVGITDINKPLIPCYEVNNNFKKEVCFFYNKDGEITSFQISSWEFEAFANKQNNNIVKSNKN